MRRVLLLLLGLQAATLTMMGHTHLQVVCEPGVDIYLNEKFISTSKWKSNGLHLKLSAGTYTAEARKEGYVPQTKKFSIEKGDVQVWRLEPFAPLAETEKAADGMGVERGFGSLTIYSQPARCTITLVRPSQSEASWPKNGKQWKASQIPAGKYTVKATHQGKTLSYDIEIPANGNVEMLFNFYSGKAHLRDVQVATTQ
jgi:hypothetical protein